MQEMQAWSLGWDDSLEKEMTTHSSILAWEISWTEEPGRLQFMGLQESDTTQWLNNNNMGVNTGQMGDKVGGRHYHFLCFYYNFWPCDCITCPKYPELNVLLKLYMCVYGNAVPKIVGNWLQVLPLALASCVALGEVTPSLGVSAPFSIQEQVRG